MYTPTQKKMKELFISYCNEQFDLVKRLRVDLGKSGFSIWEETCKEMSIPQV